MTTTLPGSAHLQSKTVTKYNSYGLVTEAGQYDFGGSVPTLKTITTYNTALTNNILDHPSTVQVFNGGGALLSQTSSKYDEGGGVTATSGTPQHVAVSGSRGNVTTVQRLVGGSTNVTQHYSSLRYWERLCGDRYKWSAEDLFVCQLQ